MKILQVNKFFYRRGGADIYFLELSRALQEAGHEIAFFSMDAPQNLETEWSKYFVDYVDFKKLEGMDRIKKSFRFIWNCQTRKKFRQLIQDFQPDIIHCHNIYHQLTPSFLPIAKKAGIPVVMHLHDYKLISADYLMFHNGKPCTKCANNSFWHCVANKCYGSLAKSLLAATETLINRDLLDIYQKSVSAFISPSRFLKNMFISAGYNGSTISVIPNFITTAHYTPLEDEKDYLLYFGRLSQEKGVDTLISAMATNNKKLHIAGSGPEEKALKEMTANLNLGDRITFTGFLEKEALKKEISESKAVIFPSICFENAPLSLLESLGKGKICLAANIGGMPEIIQHGDNGLLFKAGDSNSIAQAIDSLESISPEWMKRSAYESAKKYLLKDQLPQIVSIYEKLIKKQE